MSKDLKEALALLALIEAEWSSDPSSTACFDSRIINRTRILLARSAP